MWLAVILVCSNTLAFSCNPMVNTENQFFSFETCMDEVKLVVDSVIAGGSYSKGGCIQLGTGV
mgnify:CR=1 FL=1|tara:strand:+ start:1559 stop:1747 length:189 start_codon:yes stop_codon:yes gene_type:complete